MHVCRGLINSLRSDNDNNIPLRTHNISLKISSADGVCKTRAVSKSEFIATTLQLSLHSVLCTSFEKLMRGVEDHGRPTKFFQQYYRTSTTVLVPRLHMHTHSALWTPPLAGQEDTNTITIPTGGPCKSKKRTKLRYTYVCMQGSKVTKDKVM